MAEETLKTITELTYTGRFTPGELMFIGTVAALLVVFLLWRETRVSRRWLFPVCLVLRLSALGILLWMLAEATIVTKTEHVKPQSLAMLIDTSSSMGVVDAVDEGGTAIRWASLDGTSEGSILLAAVDQARVSLIEAERHFRRYDEASAKATSSQQDALSQTETMLQKSFRHIQSLETEIPADLPKSKKIVQSISATYAEQLMPAFKSFLEDIKAERLLARDRGRDSRDIQTLMASLKTSLSNAANGLAPEYHAVRSRTALRSIRTQFTSNRVEKVLSLIRQAKRSWMTSLENKAQIIAYRFDDAVTPLKGEHWIDALTVQDDEESMSTNISLALEQVARDAVSRSLQAAILFTDGQHNTLRDPLEAASSIADVPVYVVPLGNAESARDIVLHHAQGPRTVLKGDLVIIEAIVDAHGFKGEELVVELVRSGRVVAEERFESTSDTSVQRVVFTDNVDDVGIVDFLVRARQVPGEKFDDNNEATVTVDVIEDSIRLFIADQMPRWEYRYLRNLFKRDPSVQFRHLLFEPRKTAGGAPAEGHGFPLNQDAWNRYNVVILGDVSPDELVPNQQEMLLNFVARTGGTLILIAGQESMPDAFVGQPISKLLPVKHSRLTKDRIFKPTLTADGISTPMTHLSPNSLTNQRIWSDYIKPNWISDYSVPKQTAHVLVGLTSPGEGLRKKEERALLSWHRYGNGRVVYLSSPVTYQLRYKYGDRYHYRFWGQLLRWSVAQRMTSGSKTIRLTTDKTRYREGEEIQVSVQLNLLTGEAVKDAQVNVVARKDKSSLATVVLQSDGDVPGMYRASLERLPSGTLSIEVAGKDAQNLLSEEGYPGVVGTVIVVEPAESLEMRDTSCNLPLLTQIAEITGGQVVQPTGLGTLMLQLEMEPNVTDSLTQEPAWNKWICLWIFLICVSLEWILRKSSGLA